MSRSSQSKLSLKATMNALRDCHYDLDELAFRTGVDAETLVRVLDAHGRDENYLAIAAAADLQAMQKAHRLRDIALEELEEVVRNAEKTAHALTAAKTILDYHTQLAERVQLPAMAARIEQAMQQQSPDYGWDQPAKPEW